MGWQSAKQPRRKFQTEDAASTRYGGLREGAAHMPGPCPRSVLTGERLLSLESLEMEFSEKALSGSSALEHDHLTSQPQIPLTPGLC